MSDVLGAVEPVKPQFHAVEFRGSGGEFFRIWIVNLALTIVTLGIFSAWAKVRTRRYFYGNTFIGGHAFDYHADPVRILIGRAIAAGLFIAYNASDLISPFLALPWILIFGFAIPWLIVSSQRFNARNTSYRNVRFNFIGEYWGAFKAFVLWPFASVVTLGGLVPLAHRARDYYLINNRTFGGKPFKTTIEGWSIYKIYLIAILMLLGIVVSLAVFGGLLSAMLAGVFRNSLSAAEAPTQPGAILAAIVTGLFILVAWTGILTYVWTRVFNLVLNNSYIDGRHRIDARMAAWPLIGIGLSNLILLIVTLGMFYPWARVRLANYMADRMGLYAVSNLDEFTSEAFGAQSAVGEEIAGFFDFDIGL